MAVHGTSMGLLIPVNTVGGRRITVQGAVMDLWINVLGAVSGPRSTVGRTSQEAVMNPRTAVTTREAVTGPRTAGHGAATGLGTAVHGTIKGFLQIAAQGASTGPRTTAPGTVRNL